ncbi:MAG: ABC transporter ATP-binding protein [Oscillospiraceae bacterium]
MQFKKFIGSIREYKKSSFLSMILITGEVSMEVALPFLMSLLVDIGLGQQNLGFVFKIGGGMVLVAMASLIFGVQSGRHAAIASSGFAKNLRKDIYYNIQKFSFTNIDKFSTPSLITRLTTDITNVQNAYQMIIRTAIRAPLMLIFSTIMAMLLNWRLALVFLVSVPLLGGILFLIVMKAHPIFVKVFKQYDKLNSIVQENINGIRTVKSYVREDYEIEKFHGISKQVLFYFKKAEKILAFNSPAMQFFMFTSILVTQFLGARMIVLQTMTTGELMSLVMYLVQSLSALMLLSMVFVMIIIAQSSAERIVEVLDETSSMQNPESPVTTVENGAVVFENVGFRYHGGSEKEILKNVSFAIQSGQTVGILGGTGSAKSTLVQLIPRLYDVTSGQVKVGGLDVRSYDIEALRDAVSMVLQKMFCSRAALKTTFAGATKMPPRRKW